MKNSSLKKNSNNIDNGNYCTVPILAFSYIPMIQAFLILKNEKEIIQPLAHKG